MMMKIILVVGARPNFMKIAPAVKAIQKYNKSQESRKRMISYQLIHTGQHYDNEMSDAFFKDLNLPSPDIYLGVGSGTHAEQTGKIMIEFEKVCLREKPDLVVVVGDVNSTVACALTAVKISIQVAHVEAGLRSYDRTMPEEINRILTDQISDYLFTTCEDANQNLKREGVPNEKIFFVGNVMIDTLLAHVELAKKSQILEELRLRENGRLKKYAVLTLHRPSNVDDQSILEGILRALKKISERIPVIFPAHPRTVSRIKNFKLNGMVVFKSDSSFNNSPDNKIMLTPPLGYLDFLCLMSNATLVLTDSGGIQEETTILGVPCLTLRNNTERPITLREGTNIVVGNTPNKIVRTAFHILKNGIPQKKIPKYWDGKAAERIVKILTKAS
jgi:UDP-N-acetylglucosamine 2-epimerase (non-hydrolysing)